MSRLRATLVRLAAFAALVGLFVVPLLVVHRIAPDPIPTRAQLRVLSSTGSLDTDLALRLGSLLFFVLWAWLLVAALSEVARVMRARPRRAPETGQAPPPAFLAPDPGGVSPALLVRRLVRLAFVASIVTGPILVSTSTATARPVPVTTLAAPTEPTVVAAATTTPTAVIHVANGRDTPLSLAIDTFGDESRRGDIVELNLGRPTPDGHGWTGGVFPAGMQVLLPADARDVAPVVASAVPDAPATAPATRTVADDPSVHLVVPAPAPPDDVVVIRSGDNLWNLSRQRLDDADGETESPSETAVYDYVRQVEEHNEFASGDPNLVFAGEAVLMPSLSPLDVPASPANADDGATSAAAPDSAADVATFVAEAPATLPASAPSAGMPAAAMPAVAAPGNPTTAAPGDPVSPAASAEVFRWLAHQIPRLQAQDAPATSAVHHPDRSGVSAIAASAAALLGGLMAFGVRRRRALRLLQREPGQQLVLPSLATAAAERALHRSGRDDTVGWAWAVQRSLRRALAPLDDAPMLSTMLIGADGVTVTFDRSTPPPTGPLFEQTGPSSWRLRDAVDFDTLVRDGAGTGELAPFLVPVGNCTAGTLLVNLEAVGALHVVGPPHRERALLVALMCALANAPWARDVDLRRLGGPAALDGFDNVTVAVPDDLPALATLIAGLRGDRDGSDLYARRLRSKADDWVGTALAAFGLADVAAVADQATPGSGLVLVAGGAERHLPGAARVLIAKDGSAMLEPFSIVLTSVLGLADDDADEIAELYDITVAEADASATDPDGRAAPPLAPHRSPVGDRTAVPGAGGSAAPPTTIADSERPAGADRAVDRAVDRAADRAVDRAVGQAVAVTLLTAVPTVAVGQAAPLSPAATAVVAYLALRGPSHPQRVRDDVYGPLGITEDAFRSVVGRIRAALGLDEHGATNLHTLPDGNLALAPSVTADVAVFDEHIGGAADAAKRADALGELDALSRALDLVHARPFSGAVGVYFRWLRMPPERDGERIATAIADAAHRAASLAYAADDPVQAERLAANGLRCGAGNEALTRVLARARAARGDAAGGVAALDALGAAIRDCDPVAEPAAETQTLGAELLQRSLLQRTA